MFFLENRRQKGMIEKGSYGENSRVRITQLVMEEDHLKAIEAIHKKKNSSKSYILEEMLKNSLLYGEIKKEEIVRLKSVPVELKINYVGSHSISKSILTKVRALAKTYETTLSVVIWHMLTLFFQSHPLYLQVEYQES